MKTRLLLFTALILLGSTGLSAQQFWNTVPPGGFPSTFGTINRTGLTTIGNTSQYPLFASTNANPVPLQVRGNNIILSKVFDQTDFAALGQSGAGEAECDLWGFRAQRFFDRSVSLGVTPQGDNRAILNWGSDIKQLVFTTGSNGDCGNQVASFTIEGIRFFVPLLPGRIYVPAAEVEVDQQIEKALGDATDRIMALAPIRVESEEKLKGSEGLSYSSTDELEIDVNSLETFVPEAVATDSDGNKMVDYNEVVPLLVATLQEQQAMIDQQQALLQDMMNRLDQLDGEEAEVLEVEGAFLGQNIPNPAFNSTSIEYQLPDGAENGELVVRNVAGQVILSESLATKTGSQSIDLNNLSPGTYIYSLQVNGRVMFSKRMIVQ